MHPNVYVNRTLNLKKIRYVGFDMDHTLVRYHSHEFEALTFSAIIEKLIANRGYPVLLRKFRFEPEHTIRGLVIDKKKGNILKLSRFGAIRLSYHGTKRIDFEAQKTLYRSIYIDLNDSSYSAIDTAFSTSFAVLYAQLVDLKDTDSGNNMPTYEQIADDVVKSVDEAHADGTLKDAVRKDLPRYIVTEPDTVAGLERFIRHEKKLFVLTNSDFGYTKLLLDYCITPFLKHHKSWVDLFEFVITKAQKPRFFIDHKLDFLRIDPSTGAMTNHFGPLTKAIYQGGCATEFTAHLDVAGDDILYIGDHIYSDILRLKKECNWRTALVVEELEHEIKSLQKTKNQDQEIARLMVEKEPYEDQLLEITTRAKDETRRVDDEIMQGLQDKIAVIDKRISGIITGRDAHFNTHWGEIMRIGNEESHFAKQIENYACIYMPKIADFLTCSPRTYFRAHRRQMPHEF